MPELVQLALIWACIAVPFSCATLHIMIVAGNRREANRVLHAKLAAQNMSSIIRDPRPDVPPARIPTGAWAKAHPLTVAALNRKHRRDQENLHPITQHGRSR